MSTILNEAPFGYCCVHRVTRKRVGKIYTRVGDAKAARTHLAPYRIDRDEWKKKGEEVYAIVALYQGGEVA